MLYLYKITIKAKGEDYLYKIVANNAEEAIDIAKAMFKSANPSPQFTDEKIAESITDVVRGAKIDHIVM